MSNAKKKRITKKQKRQRKDALRFAIPLVLVTLLILGVSYAFLTLTLTGTKSNALKTGTLSLTLDDTQGEGVLLNETVPMIDEIGLTQNPYRFLLTNNGTVDSDYTVYLDDVALSTEESKIADHLIKYNLVKDGISMQTALLSTTGSNPNRVLDSGMIAKGKTLTFDLRLWLDENFTTSDMGKVFKGKIRVVAEQLQEKPYVTDGLVLYYDAINHGSNQNIWLDLSGHGNDGTLVGFSHDNTSGWTTNSLKFDGQDDIVNLNAINLDNYTVEFVVKSTKNEYNGLLMDATNGATALAIGYHSNLALFYFNANNKNGLVTSLGASLNTTMLMSYVKESATSSKAYANGVSKTNPQGVDHVFPTNNLVIGNCSWGHLEGELYTVRIYNRSLTQNEVQQNLAVDRSKYSF